MSTTRPAPIVVSSPLPGDGKSTLAGNLAVSLAAAGRQVILVDADLRRPMLATLFGLPDGAGLTDILAGRAEIADVAHNVDTSRNLAVIAAGRVPPNPSELLGSNRMRDLIRTLSERAFVIVDSPPLLPVTDAAVLATAVDGALIVITAGKTTFEMLHKAHRHARQGQRPDARHRSQSGAAAGFGGRILRLPVSG